MADRRGKPANLIQASAAMASGNRAPAVKCAETSGGVMKEPLYRWVYTMCGSSDEAETSEMARVDIDVHVQLAYPSAARASSGQ